MWRAVVLGNKREEKSPGAKRNMTKVWWMGERSYRMQRTKKSRTKFYKIGLGWKEPISTQLFGNTAKKNPNGTRKAARIDVPYLEHAGGCCILFQEEWKCYWTMALQDQCGRNNLGASSSLALWLNTSPGEVFCSSIFLSAALWSHPPFFSYISDTSY